MEGWGGGCDLHVVLNGKELLNAVVLPQPLVEMEKGIKL